MRSDIPKPIIKGTRPATGVPPFKNIEWLKQHHHEYLGLWVALYKGVLLGANENLLELHKIIENSGQLEEAVFINLKLDQFLS